MYECILHFDMIFTRTRHRGTSLKKKKIFLYISLYKSAIPHKICREIFTDACICAVQIEYLYNALEIHCWNMGCRWNIEYADAMKLL